MGNIANIITAVEDRLDLPDGLCQPLPHPSQASPMPSVKLVHWLRGRDLVVARQRLSLDLCHRANSSVHLLNLLDELNVMNTGIVPKPLTCLIWP